MGFSSMWAGVRQWRGGGRSQADRRNGSVADSGRSLDPEAPARLRLTVLEPPCRCREPLIAPEVRGRAEALLDLRGTHFQAQLGPVLQRGYHLTDGERLRVLARMVSWPLMAALQASGYRYQIVRRDPGAVEILVWRCLSSEVRALYLEAGIDARRATA